MRSKSVRSSCGSGAVYSTNSKPSVPIGLSRDWLICISAAIWLRLQLL